LYELWLMVTQNNFPETITVAEKEKLLAFKQDTFKLKKYQHKETIYRYQEINKILKKTYIVDKTKATDLRGKLDKIFTHKIFGYVLFSLILLVIFQSIFDLASVPMDFIDATFAQISDFTKSSLPEGVLTDLLTEGIIPGIGGVIIFIPQIAILFLFIAILEETGYMSRVVFLMDKIMRRFGMNGISVIPLISGTACAIPAIMATRTIASWKERLITILVVPFTTCSARLPIYAILIALIIPDKKVLGFLNLQGLVLLSLYALGFASAIIAAYILHKTLKVESRSFFVVEMPNYKLPSLKNVFFDVLEKTKAFVFGAGKIILALSIVLWFLASNGGDSYKNVENSVIENVANQQLNEDEIQQIIASKKLENSYIGILGKTIEPVIRPLGYDWKIGIALITSFAAREVFVATLATIYSVEADDENTTTIKQKMASEVNETGGTLFNFPVGMSLMVFYAFAMQCMATLAIVKRETKSWKWPLIQLFGMTILAYVCSFLTYQILS
jgi:ferrous iron transport protein B